MSFIYTDPRHASKDGNGESGLLGHLPDGTTQQIRVTPDGALIVSSDPSAVNPVLTTTFTPPTISNGQTYTDDVVLTGIVSTSIYVAQLVPVSPLPLTVSCSYFIQEDDKIRISIENQSGQNLNPPMFTIVAKKL